MMKLLLMTILLVLAAVLLLGVKVLFVKGAKFPSGHVGANPALVRRGMRCASSGTPRRRPAADIGPGSTKKP